MFELSPATGGGWDLTTLYTFKGGEDGYSPVGTLVMDKAGSLYGATKTGGNGTYFECFTGTSQSGCGTVFVLSPDRNGGWKKKTLYQFQGIGQVKDGFFPSGPLVLDPAGNLYGTTLFGGTGGCAQLGCGTVFEVSPNAIGRKETILVHFTGGNGGPGGGFPQQGVIFDSAGNLYGVTANGGPPNQVCTDGCGTAFKLRPKPGGGWTMVPLYTFPPVYAFPWSPPVLDSNGNLYGTALGPDFSGLVFKLEPSSASWKAQILHKFSGADGTQPQQLVMDNSGTLYGTTMWGGIDQPCFGAIVGCGVIFTLSPSSAGAWSETILYRFSGGSDGAFPAGPLTIDDMGNLFGVNSGNKTGSGYGTVFEILP